MVKGDDKLERLRSAPVRAPCSRTPIPQHSESQHESEVSTAPRSCIPAFAHRPAVSALLTLAGSRTTASPSQSLLQGNPSHGHGRRRSQSLSHSVSHTLEAPSRPQFSSSHSGIFPSRTQGYRYTLCLAVFSFTHSPPHI